MNFRLVSKFSKETSSPDNFRSPSPMLNQPNLSSRSCMQSAAISKLNNLTLRQTKPLALMSRNKKLSVVYSWALTSRTSSAGQPRSASNKQRSTLKMCLKSSRRKILKRALDLTWLRSSSLNNKRKLRAPKKMKANSFNLRATTYCRTLTNKWVTQVKKATNSSTREKI